MVLDLSFGIVVLTTARTHNQQARLAQSVERQALNLMVVGSSPTVGVLFTRADTLEHNV